MNISFYKKDFTAIKDNSSLKASNKTYRLIKRPIELNELTCKCKAFNQEIQPTFLVIEDERGRYFYGSLAGVPEVNSENQTEINGTDLRSMMSSDIMLDFTDISPDLNYLQYVDYVIGYLFMIWEKQHQNGFNCELIYDEKVIYKTGDESVDVSEITEHISTTDLKLQDYKTGIYNAYSVIQNFLRFYNIYMDSKIDIANKKIQFVIGKMMVNRENLQLWNYGIKNYGKIVADINESQGYVVKTENDVETWYKQSYDGIQSYKWILTSNNQITKNESLRDIFPVKRKLVTSSEDMIEANRLAIEALLDFRYNEDIDLPADVIKPDFKTCFYVYTERGGNLYKQLPCGELEYTGNNELVRFKTGYRYTSVNYI